MSPFGSPADSGPARENGERVCQGVMVETVHDPACEVPSAPGLCAWVRRGKTAKIMKPAVQGRFGRTRAK